MTHTHAHQRHLDLLALLVAVIIFIIILTTAILDVLLRNEDTGLGGNESLHGLRVGLLEHGPEEPKRNCANLVLLEELRHDAHQSGWSQMTGMARMPLARFRAMTDQASRVMKADGDIAKLEPGAATWRMRNLSV
jgi:hypothetical protein